MPLPPVVSAAARQTMSTAYDDINRTISPADSREFARTTLLDVQAAALEIERQLAARQSLRNMRRLMPLFKGLEHYSKSIDVLCNGTPFLPWIWAPITLVLRIACEYVEAFEQLIRGYSRIAESLSRFEILGGAFNKDADFQQALAVYYSDILQFHKHAYKFVRRRSWRLLFITSWGRFQGRFDNILDDMKRHEALVDKEANARNISEARKMREDIRAWRQESLEQVDRTEREQAEKQYQSIVSWLKADELDQLSIFDAISSEGRKHDGTCSWILKNRRVESWLQPKPEKPMLWLQGNPGSGKSVICTQLANFMKLAKMFTIHHFCTFSYPSSTRYENVLRSMILQLLRRDGELVAYVYEEYALGKKQPTISALEQLIQTLCTTSTGGASSADCVWIILDGLDEFEPEKQTRVLSLMNQIASKSTSPGATVCKVLLSSRPSATISGRLRHKQVVSLTDERESVQKAIRLYASQRLESIHQKLHELYIDQDDMAKIAEAIAYKADGMFLYARLVLDYITANLFISGDELKDAIEQLPETLADFYRKILSQILVQLNSVSVDRVKCIFGWIAFARRPLKKLELLSAITFNFGGSSASRLAPSFFLDVCGSLIEERKDSTLAFVHVSVKEFLRSSSSNLIIKEQDLLVEHGTAVISCLLSGLDTFVCQHHEQDKRLRVVKGVHALHVYATEYWAEYVLAQAASDSVATPCPLVTLACELSARLDAVVGSAEIPRDAEDGAPDERLVTVQRYPTLRQHLQRALKASSLAQLEAELLNRDGSEAPLDANRRPAWDGLSKTLHEYQEVIKAVLDEDECPGASAEEMRQFRGQLGASAFTCRLKSCPRATLGFSSAALCREHEIAHVRRYRCSYLDCKYPYFSSAESLKNHVNRNHKNDVRRQIIRRQNLGSLETKRGGLEPNINIVVDTRFPIVPPPNPTVVGSNITSLVSLGRDSPTEAPVAPVPLASSSHGSGPEYGFMEARRSNAARRTTGDDQTKSFPDIREPPIEVERLVRKVHGEHETGYSLLQITGWKGKNRPASSPIPPGTELQGVQSTMPGAHVQPVQHGPSQALRDYWAQVKILEQKQGQGGLIRKGQRQERNTSPTDHVPTSGAASFIGSGADALPLPRPDPDWTSLFQVKKNSSEIRSPNAMPRLDSAATESAYGKWRPVATVVDGLEPISTEEQRLKQPWQLSQMTEPEDPNIVHRANGPPIDVQGPEGDGIPSDVGRQQLAVENQEVPAGYMTGSDVFLSSLQVSRRMPPYLLDLLSSPNDPISSEYLARIRTAGIFPSLHDTQLRHGLQAIAQVLFMGRRNMRKAEVDGRAMILRAMKSELSESHAMARERVRASLEGTERDIHSNPFIIMLAKDAEGSRIRHCAIRQIYLLARGAEQRLLSEVTLAPRRFSGLPPPPPRLPHTDLSAR